MNPADAAANIPASTWEEMMRLGGPFVVVLFAITACGLMTLIVSFRLFKPGLTALFGLVKDALEKSRQAEDKRLSLDERKIGAEQTLADAIKALADSHEKCSSAQASAAADSRVAAQSAERTVNALERVHAAEQQRGK